MSVLIVIPTVAGREEYYKNCLAAYKATTPKGVEWYCTIDLDTCGEAWNEGAWWARQRDCDYVHMTADDLIPHAGWYEAAVDVIETGLYLPGAVIYEPDGSVQAHGNQPSDNYTKLQGASVPFCRTKDWVDIPNIHYWSDNAFDTAQKRVNGLTFLSHKDYAFTHYTAQAGRKSLNDAERKIFEDWKETL